MVAIGLALTLFWDSSLLRPVKLLVVLVHEMWHGLLSLAAGVRLDTIEVHWNESGKTMVTGEFTTAGFISAVSAGYIGCALTGAILLRQALVGRLERVSLILFAVLLIYFSWLFTSPLQTAFYTGIGYGLAFLLVAALGERPARGALTAIGVFFLFYSLFDLFDFTRDVDSTDAAILASYLGSGALEEGTVGFTAVTISLIWTGVILTLAYLTLVPAVREAIHYSEHPTEAPEEPGFGDEAQTADLTGGEPGSADMSEPALDPTQSPGMPSSSDTEGGSVEMYPSMDDDFGPNLESRTHGRNQSLSGQAAEVFRASSGH